jgi:hypothetical protein
MTRAAGKRGPQLHTITPPVQARPEPVFRLWRVRVVGCLWRMLASSWFWRWRVRMAGVVTDVASLGRLGRPVLPRG